MKGSLSEMCGPYVHHRGLWASLRRWLLGVERGGSGELAVPWPDMDLTGSLWLLCGEAAEAPSQAGDQETSVEAAAVTQRQED